MTTLPKLMKVSLSWGMDSLGATEAEKTMLERHFEYYKDRPGKRMIESIARLLVLHPPVHPPMVLHSSMAFETSESGRGDWLPFPGGHVFSANQNITVDEYLEEGVEEGSVHPFGMDALILCIITPNVDVTPASLKFHHKTFELIQQNLPALYLAPARLVALQVALAWDLLSPIIPFSHDPVSVQPPSQLPSSTAPTNNMMLFETSEERFTLRWQRTVMSYKDDLHVYVWQPHLRSGPRTYYSATVVSPRVTQCVPLHRRLIMCVEPTCLLSRLAARGRHTSGVSLKTSHRWNATHEVFDIVMDLFEVMAGDTHLFLTELQRKCRRTYLLHLDDCRILGIKDVVTNAATLGRLRLAMWNARFCCKAQNDSQAIKRAIEDTQTDLQYLREELILLEKIISTGKDQIMEQMSLAQGQRTLILTVAAALFIPMSFIAAIFGMNVSQPLFPKLHHTKLQSKTLPTTSSLLAASEEDSKEAEPPQHFWTMTLFLQLALPLTAGVILVPLLIGPIIRLLVQTSAHYRPYWRIWLMLFASVFLIVLAVLPSLRHAEKFDKPDEEEHDPHAGKIPIPYRDIQIAYWVAGYGVIFVLSLYLIVVAYARKRHRIRWTGFLVIILVTAATDPTMFLVSFYCWDTQPNVPWVLIPYLYAVVSWFSLTTRGLKLGDRMGKMFRNGRRRASFSYSRSRASQGNGNVDLIIGGGGQV
ncbi:hypothetical protein E4T43_04549 [Aureobasidium subglaciale]|nr:hypothetical protein E4T43_04549 [Aureobasidium subglaciale]